MEHYKKSVRVKVTANDKKKIEEYYKKNNFEISSFVDMALNEFWKDTRYYEKFNSDRRINSMYDYKNETLYIRLRVSQYANIMQHIAFSKEKNTLSKIIYQAIMQYIEKDGATGL